MHTIQYYIVVLTYMLHGKRHIWLYMYIVVCIISCPYKRPCPGYLIIVSLSIHINVYRL